MRTGKALCLNMIVKNEMANLERCLSAAEPYIACWVIGDTGSTDGTQDFIRAFFAARNVQANCLAFHSTISGRRETQRSIARTHHPSPMTIFCLQTRTWSSWSRTVIFARG